MENLQLNPITFPIWWYSIGLGIVLKWFKAEVAYGLRQTSLLFFIKHINEPFYKDYTKEGRFLGYIFRSAMLIIKLAIFLVRTVFCSAVVVLYIVALPAVVLLMLHQFIPLSIPIPF